MNCASYHFTGVRRAHNYCRVFPSIARPIDLTREQCAVSHFHGYSLIDYHDWVTRATQSSGLRRPSFICIFTVLFSGKRHWRNPYSRQLSRFRECRRFWQEFISLYASKIAGGRAGNPGRLLGTAFACREGRDQLRRSCQADSDRAFLKKIPASHICTTSLSPRHDRNYRPRDMNTSLFKAPPGYQDFNIIVVIFL
jgi:hypothetical protein